MIKIDEIALPSSCLNKAADDEPLFVLRGKDLIAPLVIDLWIEYRVQKGYNTYGDKKILDAKEAAKTMREWQLANPDRTKKRFESTR